MKNMKNIKNIVFYVMIFALCIAGGCESDGSSEDFGSNSIAVTGVYLNTVDITLAPGYSYPLIVSVEPENANQAVTWASTDPTIASVDYTGRVTAIYSGVVNITATTISGGQVAICVVTVDAESGPLSAVAIEPGTIRLQPEENVTLTPLFFPSNANDKLVSWHSSADDVATVLDGVVTAHAIGIAEITVTANDGGFTATSIVLVGDPPTSITLNKTTLVLPISERKEALVVSVAPVNAISNVAWSSNNTAVATVSAAGEVTALSAGVATITAITVDGGIVETCQVTVIPLEMVYVQGGSFIMGSDVGSSDERPLHQVTLGSFCIGKYPVTQELWETVMRHNPSHFRKGSNFPVETVSWNDAQTFITELNNITGLNFRLPTEAEWEFAARGGVQSQGYVFSGGASIDEVGWFFNSSSSLSTHPVGTKAPNELGIYDMSGNVSEWCSDWYGSYTASAKNNPTGPAQGSHRILRGGGWAVAANQCRVSHRAFDRPFASANWYGLRLALP